MAPIVAPGIARFTLTGALQSTFTWANVWDVDLLGDVTITRAEMCLNYASLIAEEWVDNIAPVTSTFAQLDSVSWVDLDSLDGSTGVVTEYGDSENAPWFGEAAVQPFPANTSLLISKGTLGGGRGTRPGRLYAIGGDEAQAGAGTLAGAYVTAITTAWQTFLDDLTDPAPGYAAQPVVVHTRNEGTPSAPDIVYVDSSPIVSMSCQSILATQRRRLRR